MKKLVVIFLCALFATQIQAGSGKSIQSFDAAYQTEFNILKNDWLYQNKRTDIKNSSFDDWFSNWIKSAVNMGLITASIGLETKTPITNSFRAVKPHKLDHSTELTCESLRRDIQDRNSNNLREAAELFDAANTIGDISANNFVKNFTKLGDPNQQLQKKLGDIAAKPGGLIQKATIYIREATIQGFVIGMVGGISPACDCAYKSTANSELNNICKNIPGAGRLRQESK